MNEIKLNKEQQLAVLAPIFKNVIVSAGAGSGKTKTLTEKVYTLIKNKELVPSELLVLTFTNNAAHEMKERIIKRFKDVGELDITNKLASAHIQTFDSFSQYLITTYSGQLGISSLISVISEDVISSKKNEILDEILDEYYLNKPDEIKKLLIHFNTQDDKQTKNVILSIYDELNKLSTDKRNDFFNKYEENYLSKNKFSEALDILVNEAKKIIKETLYLAYFKERNSINIANEDMANLLTSFSNTNIFNVPINNFSFRNKEFTNNAYKLLVSLLPLNNVAFISSLKDLLIKHVDVFPKISPRKKDIFEDEIEKEIYASFRSLIMTAKAKLSFLLNLDDNLDNEFNKILYFKDDIKLLLNIVNELDKRIFKYKKMSNSFTYLDISNMALSLLTEDKYKDIADKLRNQFKYIMIDEYQDTNDLQEIFIDSLLKDNHAHIFVVGDKKQSIYSFRNSNVALFEKRRIKYTNDNNNVAIAMNTNYRSGKELLKQINYIFSFYMSLNHGDVDYKSDLERLNYDDEVNLYKEKYDNFKIKRITSISSRNNDFYPNPIEWEALAIANDIKSKIESEYKVYDVKEGIRKCRYNDFVILIRKKKSFPIYQKIFQEFNIPLNNLLSINLKEVDPIIVLQSLVDLISYFINPNETTDVNHLFISVARSYAYSYTDQKIYDLVSNNQINEDPLMIKIKEFSNKYKNKTFEEIFLNLVDEFNIIKNLYLIGHVEDAISKIESLYQIILSLENAGEGLLDFIKLLDNISKYSLELKSDTVNEIENAVDLMTIHASKGLERKIVYMPYSYNEIGGVDQLHKADYEFSKKYGILLPYYKLITKLDDNDKYISTPYKNIFNIVLDLKKKRPAIDEHVRLFYVALTRAQNTIYIVGDDDGKRNNENLYQMLDKCPHYLLFNEEFINKKITTNKDIKTIYDKYKHLVNILINSSLSLSSKDFIDTEIFNMYQKCYQIYFVDKIHSLLDEYKKQIENILLDEYIPLIKENYEFDDINFLSRIYANIEYNIDIDKYEELENFLKEQDKKQIENLEFDDDIEDDNEEPSNINFINSEYLKKQIYGFNSYLINEKKDNLVKYISNFIYLFDGVLNYAYISYKNKEYDDIVEPFDYRKINKKNNHDIKAKKPDIDDKEIKFNVRDTKRASKLYLEDKEDIKKITSKGIHLHKLMELAVELNSTEFIKDKKDKTIIDNVLSNELFIKLKDGYKQCEYQYFDNLTHTSGVIDLLVIFKNEYYIIDYKSKNIDDVEYQNQLYTYRRNIQTIFNIDKDKIHLYLISLIDNKVMNIN